MADTPHATILIVDDTEATRYAVGRILRKAKYKVQEASTGQEALRLAADKPDLIILDVNLPDMNGFEVCQRIKANSATAATPVLHLSASFVHSDARAEGLESGADGYLTHPIEPRELIANVEALLRVRQAEKTARAQRELLQVTLSSIGDGVVATDAQGSVTFINPVAEGMIGWSQAEVIGKPLDDLFHIVGKGADEPIENPVAQVLRTGKASAMTNQRMLIGRDGTRRPIDDTATPIRDHDGQFVGVILVFRDITERKRLEDELRRRSEDLADRDRRKDEFLAMLAHELRNPLASIRNGLHILRLKAGGDAEDVEAGAMTERQVSHLSRLIDDLLDVSRVTRGKLELQLTTVDLVAAVDRSIEAVRPLVVERGHHLEVELPDSPLCLRADPVRLEQMLSNLLTNAAKYTDTGGYIRLAATREGAEAVVRVRDNGIGVREEMLPRLFDVFQQADRVPGRVTEGLGLGLSLVRSLATMHGGSVTASSPGPGMGSEFVLRLPALPAGISANSPESDLASQRSVVRQLRVLITDDNADSAESMAMLLRLSGHEVRTAHDGPATLDEARSFHPHAIFLDIGLPRGMDGYEVARHLRRQQGTERILLVAMTGYGQASDRERSKLAGFDHHLVKPADLTEIDRLLRERANALEDAAAK